MDIELLGASDSVEFELKYPSGESTGVTFNVTGQYSSGYNLLAAKINKIISALDCSDEEKADRRIIETAIACVKGWSGLEKEEKPLEFSEANCREMLEKPTHNWVATQIYLRVIGEKGFFTKA
jgi:hypothetical protein